MRCKNNITLDCSRLCVLRGCYFAFFDCFLFVGFTIAVASSFRWIVDNELLRKNNLICPEDYITEKLPLAKAPKSKF